MLSWPSILHGTGTNDPWPPEINNKNTQLCPLSICLCASVYQQGIIPNPEHPPTFLSCGSAGDEGHGR